MVRFDFRFPGVMVIFTFAMFLLQISTTTACGRKHQKSRRLHKRGIAGTSTTNACFAGTAFLEPCTFFKSEKACSNSVGCQWTSNSCTQDPLMVREVCSNMTLWAAISPSTAFKPTISVYLPTSSSRSDSQVILLPGGGYEIIGIPEDLVAMPDLLSRGVTVLVLIYSTGSRSSPDYPEVLRQGQRVVSLVRARAEDWGLNANRIAVLGLSAGGHLGSFVATHQKPGMFAVQDDEFDAVSPLPNIALLISPIILMTLEALPGDRIGRLALLGSNPPHNQVNEVDNKLWISDNTPSMFVFHCIDDPIVSSVNSMEFSTALKQVISNSSQVRHDQFLFDNCALHGATAFNFWKNALVAYLSQPGVNWFSSVGSSLSGASSAKLAHGQTFRNSKGRQ